MRVVLLAGALILLGLAAHAATINVPADQPTIQAAIDAATAGDTIQVAAGTYRENVVWDSKDLTIAGAGIGNTVIDGDVDSDGTPDGRCMTMLTLTSASSISGFTFADGAAPAALPQGGGIYMNLADVFIANCEIRDCNAAAGGGVWLYNSSDAVFDGLTIHDCSATNWGGGIYAALGPDIITVCEINNNTANYGGGMYLAGAATGTTVDSCFIHDNEASTDGGGVLLNETYATFKENVMTANLADRGGAMYLLGSSATIIGNVIHHNFCGIFPAGIALLNSPATIEGNTIADNDDGGISNGTTIATTPLVVTNNILWGNMSADLSGTDLNSSYNTIGLGVTAGTGNITSDPLFADSANGDYHLKSVQGRWTGLTWVQDLVDSPAIDAGDPASAFANEPPPNGGRRNMGAYGNTGQASLTGDGQTPAVSGVTITPDPAYTGDTLTAVPGTWFDPNGDPEGYDFQWAKWDGAAWQDLAGETGDTLAASNFVKGDMIQVTCWPNDGTNVGLPVTDDITIGNTAPTVTSVEITPDPPCATATLTATPTGWSDADGDPEGYDWQWEVDSGGGFAVVPGATTDTLAPGSFAAGDQVRVTATPNDGSDTGTPVTDTVTVADCWNLSLLDASAGHVEVNGVAQTLPYSSTYPVGTAMTLLAVATAPNMEFDRWSGDVPAGQELTNPLTFNMDSDRTIDAHFRPVRRTLTIDYASAGSVLVNGTPRTLPYQVDIPLGNTVTVKPVPNSGWAFQTWTGDIPAGSEYDDPIQLVMDQDRTIDPHFVPQRWQLSLTDALRGDVLVNGVPRTLPWSGMFDHGAVVEITPVPDPGWKLDMFTGDVPAGSERDNPLSVTMDQNRTINTHFRPATRELAILNATRGSVIVDGVPHALPWVGTVADGSVVTIEGVANPGWMFDQWSGDVPVGSVLSNPLALTMNRDRTIRPHFKPGTRHLSILYASAGTVLVDGTPHALPWEGDIALNAVVTIDAVPNSGWLFQTWSGDVPAGSELDDPLALTMDRDRTIRPHFIPDGGTAPAQVLGVNAMPTHVGTEITFTLSSTASVSAEVLNIAGRTVKHIVTDRLYEQGPQSLIWNGYSDFGTRAPSGTYLVRITAHDASGDRCRRLSTVQVR